MKQSRGAENERTRAVHFQDGAASVTSTTGKSSAKKGLWSRLRNAFPKRKASPSTVSHQPETDTQRSPERTPHVNEAVDLRVQDAVSRISTASGTTALGKFTTFDDLWSRIPDNSNSSDSEGLMRDWSGRLKEGEWIGGGGFGDVYKGIWEHVSDIDPTSVPVVVVKVIQQRSLRKHEKRSVKMFNREIKICLQLQHPNVVSFIGVAFGFGDPQKSELPALVSLWMPNGESIEFGWTGFTQSSHAIGTVKDYLESRIQPSLVDMFLDIAKGIEYLHTFNPQIVHGDIKAENILVDHQGRLRVTDFGLSRMMVDQADWATTAFEAPGTDRWMAPELLDATQTTVTKESDIYALGLTFLEMITLEPPFSQYKHRGAVIAAVLVRKETPLRPLRVGDATWQLLVSAWAYAATDRPKISQIISSLKLELQQVNSYTGFILDPQNFTTGGWCDWTEYLVTESYIGEGGFHEYYVGKWTPIAREKRICIGKVVIMQMRAWKWRTSTSRDRLKFIRREIDVSSRIRHKNVVSFLGIVYLHAEFPSLVFEFAENGLLSNYLQANPTASRYPYLSDIAKAVEYMHSFTPQIIHGNLKGGKLLVKGDGTLLLGGFEFARVTEDVSLWVTSSSNPGAGGTTRWMAPELLRGDVAHASAAADTYAFGMVIVEIFTGKIPFHVYRREAEVIFAVLDRKERPVQPIALPEWLWSIASLCWAEVPESRPRMSEVVQLFEASQSEWQD